MKNKIGIFMLLFLLITTVTLFGETAATVNLIRDEIISVEELNSRVAQYRAEAAKAGSTVPITPLEVLDVMINDKLVLQGASRDGYMVNDVQVESLLKQQKEYLTQQTGQHITDAQFELAIKQSYGMTLTEFKKALKESTTVDNYVKATQSSILSDIPEPTDAAINEFYRANRAEFINPELVRLSHIFMPFTPETKTSVKKEMDTVARFLRYNTYTFEELVPKYSKDAESVGKGGDIGWLAYDDENMKAALGADFFEKVFELNLGKPSGVLESKAGYHIVKITTHTDPKLLSITDRINPDSNTTVKQYIRQVLLNRSQQNAYLKAIDTLVASLRDEATIDILYKGEKLKLRSRHMGREIALSTLYSLDFNGVLYNQTGTPDFPTLNEEEQKSLDFETATFARYLISGTLEHLTEIDSVISRFSINRPLDKIDIIDRNVLRMSVFSILYDKEIHASVVITEAVRLSQEYSREVNYKFINGILDSIVKERT